tara:strand:- start:37 stop:1023 length:987 start_codon:yes stop_codon:yes gene_type:complete
MQNDSNNGVVEKVPKQIGNHFNLIPGNSISAFTHLNKVYYQEEPFYSKQGSNVYTLRNKFLNKPISKFIVSAINSVIGIIEYGKNTASRLKNYKIQLPTKNGKIDFDFIESFVAKLENEHILQLENYINEIGLSDYHLTEKETQTLVDFENGGIEFKDFTFKNIFNKIKQGRRLKKDDQIAGNIPFVMSGVTDTGVVNYISNPVANFPKNSITIDIFGNTFYRNYAYGAGDDTGVYWSDKTEYSKEIMVFFASAMAKSVLGKFDYGKKLRSSKSYDFKMTLPVKDGKPDYETMETIISAIHKLVIKDVVLYVEKKKKELNKLTENANA